MLLIGLLGNKFLHGSCVYVVLYRYTLYLIIYRSCEGANLRTKQTLTSNAPNCICQMGIIIYRPQSDVRIDERSTEGLSLVPGPRRATSECQALMISRLKMFLLCHFSHIQSLLNMFRFFKSQNLTLIEGGWLKWKWAFEKYIYYLKFIFILVFENLRFLSD